MTTEELARRFAELCGWESRTFDVGDGDPVSYWKTTDGSHVTGLHGWAGVGIVVDEMRRRGFAYMLRIWSERMHAAAFTKKNWPTEDDFFGTYEKRNGAVGDTPLDAVLAAANAALEAEAGR